jgi:hypothetical protein
MEDSGSGSESSIEEGLTWRPGRSVESFSVGPRFCVHKRVIREDRPCPECALTTETTCNTKTQVQQQPNPLPKGADIDVTVGTEEAGTAVTPWANATVTDAELAAYFDNALISSSGIVKTIPAGTHRVEGTSVGARKEQQAAAGADSSDSDSGSADDFQNLEKKRTKKPAGCFAAVFNYRKSFF